MNKFSRESFIYLSLMCICLLRDVRRSFIPPMEVLNLVDSPCTARRIDLVDSCKIITSFFKVDNFILHRLRNVSASRTQPDTNGLIFAKSDAYVMKPYDTECTPSHVVVFLRIWIHLTRFSAYLLLSSVRLV